MNEMKDWIWMLAAIGLMALCCLGHLIQLEFAQ